MVSLIQYNFLDDVLTQIGFYENDVRQYKIFTLSSSIDRTQKIRSFFNEIKSIGFLSSEL